MSGTPEGGAKVKAKLLAKDPDYYKKIGSIGGQNSNTGGFRYNRELARIAGAKGGKNRWEKKKAQDAKTN